MSKFLIATTIGLALSFSLQFAIAKDGLPDVTKTPSPGSAPPAPSPYPNQGGNVPDGSGSSGKVKISPLASGNEKSTAKFIGETEKKLRAKSSSPDVNAGSRNGANSSNAGHHR